MILDKAYFWFRVDDRLIHGQVMVGWVLPFDIHRIILINDEVACDSWKKDILLSSVYSFADDVELLICSKKELSDIIVNIENNIKTMMLVASVQDAFQICRAGVIPNAINLGGIHSSAGRTMVTSFLNLDSNDIEAILDLKDMGIKLMAQDLPASRIFNVLDWIERKNER